MLITNLLAIAATLASGPGYTERATAAAADCAEAVDRLYPTTDEATKTRVARRWYMMSFFESAFFTSPKGPNDNGAACGVLQTHLPQAECARARKDRIFAYQRGIEIGEALVTACGGIEEGMSAYASGTCPKAGKVLMVIHWRCKRIGGC